MTEKAYIPSVDPRFCSEWTAALDAAHEANVDEDGMVTIWLDADSG